MSADPNEALSRRGFLAISAATLGGVLATICPADKKIIHGMKDAVFAPCSLGA